MDFRDVDLLTAAVADGMIAMVPPRGLPRDLADQLPVPFAMRRNEMGDVAWASIDTKLTTLCTMGRYCHVCGEAITDEEAWSFLEGMGRVVDGWVMHERCAKLSKAHCPFLRAAVDEGDVHMAPTPGDVVAGLRAETMRKALR